MKITPLEIRQKTFQKAFRGLDKEDVNAFMIALSKEWEILLQEKRELQAKNELNEKELEKMRKVEATLYKTLQTAEDTGNNVIESANKSAELHIKEAKLEVEGLLREAQTNAKNIIDEAENQAKNTIEDMYTEVKELHLQYETLMSHYETLVSDLETLNQNLLLKTAKSKEHIQSIRANEILKKSKQLLHEQKNASAFNFNTLNNLNKPVEGAPPIPEPQKKQDHLFTTTSDSQREKEKPLDSTPIQDSSFFDEI